jgi:hypothetical protein
MLECGVFADLRQDVKKIEFLIGPAAGEADRMKARLERELGASHVYPM